MNNVNVNFEVKNSAECSLISERKNIINIKSVESNHRINFAIFKKNEINETFNEFCYDNVNKHIENRVYVFAIVILRFVIILFVIFFFITSTFFKSSFICAFCASFARALNEKI